MTLSTPNTDIKNDINSSSNDLRPPLHCWPKMRYSHDSTGQITLDNGYLTDHLTSDLAMLRTLGAKFIGRAAHVWVFPNNDDERFQQATDFASAVHQQVDDDIVLQCAVFEAIFPGVNTVPIPPWVFEVLGEPVEQRNFNFADMHSDLRMAPQQAFVWLDDGEVPDFTLAEARRWYIYRIGRYFDAGYEAIHLGQIHLVAARDAGFHHLAQLIATIRRLAQQRARRGEVIIDAHSHGIARQGQLLLDFREPTAVWARPSSR